MISSATENLVQISDHSGFKSALRGKEDFWSIDSQPAKLSGPVSVWQAPALILAFTLISSFLLFAVSNVSMLKDWFPFGDLVLAPASGSHSVALRIFTVSFLASFAAFANGTVRSRLKLGILSIGAFAASCIAVDFDLTAWVEMGGAAPSLPWWKSHLA